MKCPNCGTKVGNSHFCPVCGADITSDVRRRRTFIRSLDHKARYGISTMVVLVAVVSVALVVLSTFSDDPSDDTGGELPEGVIDAGGGNYIYTDEKFRESFIAYMDTTGQMVIELDGELSAGYTRFVWELRDDLLAAPSTITKEAPVLTWKEPSLGSWTVIVYCYDGEAEDVTYYGGFEYIGDYRSDLVWIHDNRTLTISCVITLDEFLVFQGLDGDRTEESLGNAMGYVTPSGSIAALEDRIWRSYSAAFSHTRNSTDYANCLMEMVDQCLEVRDDAVIHAQSTYWQYPVETLYLGVGDSGDLSVLAASLLGSAGFGVSLVYAPDGWMVGVEGTLPHSGAVEGYAVLIADGFSVCPVDGYVGMAMVPDHFGYDRGITYHGDRLVHPYGMLAYRDMF